MLIYGKAMAGKLQSKRYQIPSRHSFYWARKALP